MKRSERRRLLRAGPFWDSRINAAAAFAEAPSQNGCRRVQKGQGGAVHARQFPRNSGYPEDAATGIAAAALFYGLGAPKAGLLVRQGEAMGRPSEIRVRCDPDGPGCRLGGRVEVVF